MFKNKNKNTKQASIHFNMYKHFESRSYLINFNEWIE